MGAAESPDRKRRRHYSKERHREHGAERSRERSRDRSRERSSHRSRDEANGRHRHGHDDRPASTSGREHHESRQGREVGYPNGREGASRQLDSDRQHRDEVQDRQADRSRDRSRDRHSEREREYDRDRRHDRGQDGDRDRHRGGDRYEDRADRGRDMQRGQDRKADLPSSSRGGRDDRGADHSRGARSEQQQQQQQEHRAGPSQQRDHSHRGGGRPEGPGRQSQQQRGRQEPEGKPKWGKPEEWAADEPPPPGPPKQGPNLGLSGKLAAETNKTADGTAELKFQAPAEARVCKKPVWKLFTYKGSEQLGEPINLTQLPFYLFGKDRKVADIPTDHPSCSRQHAVLVFREVEADAPDGIGYVRKVKPYMLDLETTNGTTINNERLEGARYYELLSADVIRFGMSSREYVIMDESVVQ